MYLKLLYDAGEGQVVSAALLEQRHAAVILWDVGVKDPEVLPTGQDHIHNALVLLPV